MLDYLLKLENGWIQKVQDGKSVFLDEPLSRILQPLAHAGLSTLEGRIQATGKTFQLRQKVPVYLSRELLFMQIYGFRSPKCLLINFYAIRSIQKNRFGETALTFWDGVILSPVPSAAVTRQISICQRIEIYLSKLY
jgi:hypothetical protein